MERVRPEGRLNHVRHVTLTGSLVAVLKLSVGVLVVHTQVVIGTVRNAHQLAPPRNPGSRSGNSTSIVLPSRHVLRTLEAAQRKGSIPR